MDVKVYHLNQDNTIDCLAVAIMRNGLNVKSVYIDPINKIALLFIKTKIRQKYKSINYECNEDFLVYSVGIL